MLKSRSVNLHYGIIHLIYFKRPGENPCKSKVQATEIYESFLNRNSERIPRPAEAGLRG
jgi:hypothetical protein